MSLLFGRKRKIPIPPTSSTSTENIGSDRLRKAIERNRAKQMKRDEMGVSRPSSGYSNPTGFERPMDRNLPPRENPYREPDRFDREDFNRPSPQSYAPPRPTNSRPMPSRPTSSGMAARPPVSRPLPGSSPSRPLPGSNPSRPPLGSSPSRPLPSSGYRSSSPTYLGTSTNKPPSKFAGYFLKGLWIFSVFLLMRLIFTERGVVEYYGRTGNLKQKFEKLSSIKKANKNLSEEIKKIRKNTAYQKSLVRNHLGFIARDEFIVLLPD